MDEPGLSVAVGEVSGDVGAFVLPAGAFPVGPTVLVGVYSCR